MKVRACIVLLMAVAALGAGPPPKELIAQPPAEQPSAWSKFKSGARRLVPGGAAPQSTGAEPRYDDQVRQATAVAPQPRRRGLFKSTPRTRRTLTEYMAWEKP